MITNFKRPIDTTKFSQCSCINCGTKLSCFEYTGAVHGTFVCCSKRCWYDFMGYDDDELEKLERQGELNDDFGLMEVEGET